MLNPWLLEARLCKKYEGDERLKNKYTKAEKMS